MGQRYNVPPAQRHADHRDLLAQPNLEAALILSGGSHCQPVVDAADAGLQIFVEKPLGENLDEVQQVAQAVRAAGVTLMVGYHKRYDPGYELARQQVQALGADLRLARVEVLHPVDARARDHYWLEPPRDPAAAARENSEATDGLVQAATTGPARARIEAIIGPDADEARRVATFLLFNSLIHDTNALRGILGEPAEVLHASCWRGGRCIHVLLRWRQGLRCTLTWIYLPGLPHYKEELLFLSPERRVALTFPSPYFKHLPTPVTIESADQGRLVQQQITVSYDEAFRRELQHFHRCVRQGAQPLTGIDDALADTRLLEQIARAL